MPPLFPQFAPLTLDDKEIYEKLVLEYPPLSNISFTGMQLWWNEEGKLSISSLNGNVVINYHQPYDKKNSGLSIVGKSLLVHSMSCLWRMVVSVGMFPASFQVESLEEQMFFLLLRLMDLLFLLLM